MRPPAGLTRSLPLVGLGVAVTLWGTSFVAAKAALTGFPPYAVVGGRMLLASALMLPLWNRLPAPDRRPGDGRRLLVLAVMYPTLYYVAEMQALSLTTASQAGTVSAIGPLVVAAGAWLFLGERLRARALAGLLVSIGGVVILSLDARESASAPNPALGNALEMLAMCVAASSTILLKRLTGRWNPWLLTGAQLGFGAVVFLPFVLVTPMTTWTSAPPAAWAGLLYLGIAVTLPPSGLFNLAISRMPAAQAVMAVNLIPVIAILTGWAILGDAMSALQWGACAVILAGVLMGQLGGAGTPSPVPPAPIEPGDPSTRSAPA
jgi:drug/metabolite transporter (DMT)-like permease